MRLGYLKIEGLSSGELLLQWDDMSKFAFSLDLLVIKILLDDFFSVVFSTEAIFSSELCFVIGWLLVLTHLLLK